MFNFAVNFFKIIAENLPTFLRKPVLLNLILVMASPFIKIYNDTLLQYNLFLTKIKYKGTVISMEQMLNDYFDVDLRRIIIIQPNNYSPVYILRDDEFAVDIDGLYIVPVGISCFTPFVIYHASEMTTSYDFTVQCPASFEAGLTSKQKDFLSALVNYYRLAGKSWNLIYV